ncbi:hypothetical protein PoB_007545500 [Plakobranchus ocellatus]|uniref:Uncharacterized protein n=1 Tax=Plakobranchus ocellatus TaxID=259542 RepID=A0AAV4DY66_9GAST|nr:hypothetical protein PoB_007545500 [Plakobranchus ocellatus]
MQTFLLALCVALLVSTSLAMKVDEEDNAVQKSLDWVCTLPLPGERSTRRSEEFVTMARRILGLKLPGSNLTNAFFAVSSKNRALSAVYGKLNMNLQRLYVAGFLCHQRRG